jgi:hypothetical protein
MLVHPPPLLARCAPLHLASSFGTCELSAFLATVAALIACDIHAGPIAATTSILATVRASVLAAVPDRATATARAATLAASTTVLVVA